MILLCDRMDNKKNKISKIVKETISLQWRGKEAQHIEGVTLGESFKNILKNAVLHSLNQKDIRTGVFAKTKSFTNKNYILKGDNLYWLKIIQEDFAQKVKLIYIDPPYNTGNDSFNYNDSFAHSHWLSFMKHRLEAALPLMKEDGFILVQIDNSASNQNESPELGYLLVLMDEIFGRKNYVTTFTWKKKGNASNTEQGIGTITESIIMYARDKSKMKTNIQEYERAYKHNDEQESYNLELPVKTNEGTYERKTMQFAIKTKEGIFLPPAGKRWTIGEALAKKIVAENKYVIAGGKFKIKKYKADYKRGNGKLFNNLLLEEGSLKMAKEELKKLGFAREDFGSPKPELLMKTLLEITTKPGDLVLDFFLGSGTTCAVAHKMNRQYIGVEQMDFINNIIVPRLQKVIAGEQGGISKVVNWKSGGAFNYMEL